MLRFIERHTQTADTSAGLIDPSNRGESFFKWSQTNGEEKQGFTFQIYLIVLWNFSILF